MLKTCWERMQKMHPLIYNITNYVTANAVANTLLACGASPIMSDEPMEAEELAGHCDGLNINLGTLNQSSISAMFLAGKTAHRLSRVTVLDPVGVGVTSLRTETSKKLMAAIPFTAMKGNISEIKTLALGTGTPKGVDAGHDDAVTEETLDSCIALVKEYSRRTGAVIAVTGAIDLVADGEHCYVIRNGHPAMTGVTGLGCQLSGLMTALLAANPISPLPAAAAAVCAMGLAGEIGYRNLQKMEGNASYGRRITDALSQMTGDSLKAGAKIEVQ